jgi:hypothetical protein
VFVYPSFSHVSQELLFGGSHLADQRLVAGFLMARGPQHHLSKHGRKINALGRKRVNQFPPIGGILLGADNFVGFQPAKPIRQNIGGDFFVGAQKFMKGFIAAQHHVSQDQQRPSIAQHFHRSIQRTNGAAPGRRFLFSHKGRVAFFTCKMQVRLADSIFGRKTGELTHSYVGMYSGPYGASCYHFRCF